MTRIKICGLTRSEDVQLAAQAGADALGFIFAESPRRVEVERARQLVAQVPPFVQTVGVFLDPSIEDVYATVTATGLQVVQLHGEEPAELCADIACPVLKRIRVHSEDDAGSLRRRMAEYEGVSILLDPGSGEGRTFDWRIAADLPGPLILAGGLNPDNVADAIRTVRPWGVDVASGIEREPGIKDEQALRDFVRAVRKIDAEIDAGIPA